MLGGRSLLTVGVRTNLRGLTQGMYHLLREPGIQDPASHLRWETVVGGRRDFDNRFQGRHSKDTFKDVLAALAAVASTEMSSDVLMPDRSASPVRVEECECRGNNTFEQSSLRAYPRQDANPHQNTQQMPR